MTASQNSVESRGESEVLTVTPRKQRLSLKDLHERCEGMVDDIVGPDTTPPMPHFNFPSFYPRVPEPAPRSTTPPARYFEDPDFDIDPFSPQQGPSQQLFSGSPMEWLSNNLEAGQMSGRPNVGDSYYRAPLPGTG